MNARTLTFIITMLPLILHAQFFTISPRSIPPIYMSKTPVAEAERDSIHSDDTSVGEPIDTIGLERTSTPLQLASTQHASTAELALESEALVDMEETPLSISIDGDRLPAHDFSGGNVPTNTHDLPIVNSESNSPLRIVAHKAMSEGSATIGATNATSEEYAFAPSLWCHPPLRVKLRVTSPYGQRRNPFDSTLTEFHSGLDLAAPQGTPVFTMLPGEVLATGHTDRAGNYIKLKHGNIIVTYCHLLRQPTIPLGTHLLPGIPIAQVGTTGRSTAPHLHISVKISNRPIDPALLLRLLKIL